MAAPFSVIPQPMIGMNYEPAPSDDMTNPPPGPYGDTDFTNSDFADLWGGTRSDLQTIKDLGCNTVKMYNWSVPPPPPLSYWQRDHTGFLAACRTLGLKAIVPISNYFCGVAYCNRTGGGQPGPNPDLANWITQIVKEVYADGSPGAACLWAIGNEYDLIGRGAYAYFEAQDVAAIAACILAAEKALGVMQGLAFTSPVSTAMKPINPSIPTSQAPYNTIMGGSAIEALIAAFNANPAIGPSLTAERFMASVNSYQIGQQLTDYYNAFPKVFASTPFFYGELGFSAFTGTAAQAQNIYSQFATTIPQAQPGSHFYGSCVFEFSDEMWKGPPKSSEVMFGIYTFAAPDNPKTAQQGNHDPVWGAAYPVDQLAARPAVQCLQAAIQGKPMPG